jgi:hypothetical protein
MDEGQASTRRTLRTQNSELRIVHQHDYHITYNIYRHQSFIFYYQSADGEPRQMQNNPPPSGLPPTFSSNADALAAARMPLGDEYEEIREQVRSFLISSLLMCCTILCSTKRLIVIIPHGVYKMEM